MLNFALVGCGRIAKRYGELLGAHKIDGARLVAVCDVSEERAKEVSNKYDVPYYLDANTMLETMGDIDVLCVLTPSGYHADHVVELSRHGKHIIVEKPMALTIEDADNMIRHCDKNGVRLFVVKQNRFNNPVIKLKKAVDDGRFGKMVMGTVRVRWSRDQNYYDKDAWRGTWAYDGGVFANQASHHIDLLLYMMGDVESVYAKGGTYLVDIETEDTGVAVIKFVNGALGIIEATTAIRPKDLEGSISILGEKGSVEIGGFAVNEMKHWNFNDEGPADKEMLEKYSTNPPDVYGFGHKAYLEHVVECINTQKSLLVDGFEGRRSLEVISALYESVETGKEVFLKYRPRKSKLGKR